MKINNLLIHITREDLKLNYGNYLVIKRTEDYHLIKSLKGRYYFLKYITTQDAFKEYNLRQKCSRAKNVKDDEYIIRVNDGDYLYDAKNNIILSDKYSEINPSKIDGIYEIEDNLINSNGEVITVNGTITRCGELSGSILDKNSNKFYNKTEYQKIKSKK